MKIFLDLDGTLAKFNEEVNALERFEKEKGFFANLEAFENIEVINDMVDKTEVYIISASPNQQADNDKIKWINKYLERVHKDKILLCRLGVNKAEFIKEKIGVTIDSSCMLLDDYGHNLIQWEQAGGIAVKRLNKEADNSRKLIQREIRDLQELLKMI